MALPALRNRVKETTLSTGTGPVQPNGAALHYRSFATSGLPSLATFPYAIEVPSGPWECGTATLNPSGTISRSMEDSSTGALLALTGEAGTTISLSAVASYFGQLAASGALPTIVVAASSTSQTLAFPPFGNAEYDVTLTGNCAFTLSGVGLPGQTITLITRQDQTAGRVITLPIGIKWPGGVVPVPATTADGVDTFTFSATALRGGVLGTWTHSQTPTPVANGVLVFDYLPARDGLQLLTHGSSGTLDAGYAAAAAANPLAIWQPRYIPQGTDVRGGSDTYSGNYQYNVDPEASIWGGFTPFAIANGLLRIRAQLASSLGITAPTDPNSNAPYPYLSGLLTTKSRFSQQGGYFEIAAQLPHGTALWDAAWLIPVSETHPPELDIVEYLGQDPATTYRVDAISAGATQNSLTTTQAVDLSLAVHLYGVWVRDYSIQFFFDNQLVFTLDTTRMPEMQALYYILLCLQVGSRLPQWVTAPDGTTPVISDMLVQWIRVWQIPGPNGLHLSATSYFDNLAVGQPIATITADWYGADNTFTYAQLTDPDSAYTVSGNQLLKRANVAGATHETALRVTDKTGRSHRRLFTLTQATSAVVNNLVPSSDFTTNYWNKENVNVTANRVSETNQTNSFDVFLVTPIAKSASPARYRLTVDATADQLVPWLFIQGFANTGGSTDYGTNVVGWFNVAGSAIGYTATNGNWSNVASLITALTGGTIRLQLDFTTANETGIVFLLRLALGQDQTNYAGNSAHSMKLENVSLSVLS